MQRYGGLLVSDLPKPLVRGSLIPLSAMLLLFLFADLFGMYLFQHTEWSSYVFIGVFQAQAGIFCILGGTVGRSWISSFLLSAALAVVSVALFFGGSFWTNDEVPLTEAAVLAIGVVPPLLFCGCVPLLFLRSFNGWHLSRSTVALTEPYSLRIEDFFMAMILVAGLLAIAPSAFGFATANRGEEDLSILLFSSVISAVASTVAVFAGKHYLLSNFDASWPYRCFVLLRYVGINCFNRLPIWLPTLERGQLSVRDSRLSSFPILCGHIDGSFFAWVKGLALERFSYAGDRESKQVD